MPRKAVVRPATAADMDAFYGHEANRPSITAIVGELDGKIIACGGFAHQKGILEAFCDLEPEARDLPVQLIRETRKLIRGMGAKGKMIYATADRREPSHEHFLRLLGFKPVEGMEGRWRWVA